MASSAHALGPETADTTTPAQLRLTAAENPDEFLRQIKVFADKFKGSAPYRAVWYEFLRGDIGPRGFVPGLTIPFWSLESTKFSIFKAEEYQELLRFDRTPHLPAIKALTKRVKDSLPTFFADWARTERIHHHSYLLTAVDWTDVFADRSAAEIQSMLESYPKIFSSDEQGFWPLREGILKRLSALARTEAPLSPATLATITTALNLSITASPATDELVRLALPSLRLEVGTAGADRLLHFLRHARAVHFQDPRAFETLYADTLVRTISPSGRFSERPLHAIRFELDDTRARFDVATANRILQRMAEHYRATPKQLNDFKVGEPKDAAKFDPVTRWDRFLSGLTDQDVRDLHETLVGGTTLPRRDFWKFQLALLGAGLPVHLPHLGTEIGRLFGQIGERRMRRFFEDPLQDRLPPPSRPTLVSMTRERLDAAPDHEQLRSVYTSVRDPIYHQAYESHHDYEPLDGRATATFVWPSLLRIGVRLDHLAEFVSALRGATPTMPAVQTEIASSLARIGLSLSTEDALPFLARAFRDLPARDRVSVLRTLLTDASRDDNDEVQLHSIFMIITSELHDESARRAFIQIWEAGMEALSPAARVTVAAIALAEPKSSNVSQRAIAAIFAQLGLLDSPVVDALTPDLPSHLRTEIAGLDDDTSQIEWWMAWSLLIEQYPGLYDAGWRLSRIVDADSMVARLELQLERPRDQYLIRHGEETQPVIVTVRQVSETPPSTVEPARLRAFAATLSKADPSRRVTVPLLMEDAIRSRLAPETPREERRLNASVASAYRRAALGLGGIVDDEGTLHVAGWSIPNAPARTIVLANGTRIDAEPTIEGVSLEAFKAIDPAAHRELVKILLGLADAVNHDASAPVLEHPERVSYVISPATKTVAIVDHGRALRLNWYARQIFADFARRAYADDVLGLARLVRELTTIDVGLAAFAARSDHVASSARPVAYLAAVASPFLALSDGDWRKTAFLDLAHGVRAEVQLLEWEAAEGLTDLKDVFEARVDAPERGLRYWLLSARAHLRRLVASTKSRLGRVRAKRSGPMYESLAHMVDAYKRPPAPCETDLFDVSETTPVN